MTGRATSLGLRALLGAWAVTLLEGDPRPGPTHLVVDADWPARRVRPAPLRRSQPSPVATSGAGYTAPFVPPYRTSLDGRLGIVGRTMELGPEDEPQVMFNLLRPEALDRAPSVASDALQLLEHADPEYTDRRLPASRFHGGSGALTQLSICESSAHNPWSDGDLDRYDLNVVGSLELPGATQLWVTPIRVFVSKPKTAEARIEHIEVLAPRGGEPLPLPHLKTMSWSGDGRLLIGSTSAKFEGLPGRFKVVYGLVGDTSDPCDVTKLTWDRIHPIARLPHDEEARGRYPIAQYPFRDGMGRPVAPDDDLDAAYTWLDREARSLFFFTDWTTLHFERDGELHTRYPTRCVGETPCELSPEPPVIDTEKTGRSRGLSFVGSWTHGKVVTLDGRLSGIDYGMQLAPETQREIELYDDGGWVRLAAARALGEEMGRLPASVYSTTHIDSIENLFNFHAHMRPVTPRDVVWTMSTGSSTDEVVFDDYLDPRMVVFSEMNAAYRQGGGGVSNGTAPEADGFDHGVDGAWTILLANSATSLSFDPPAAGGVEGPARIEPVAMGGVFGKGLFLPGNTRVVYPLTSSVAGRSWYLGLFVDSRDPDGDQERVLVELPSGARLSVSEARGELALYGAGGAVRWRRPVPGGFVGRWRHLGLQSLDGRLEVFVDGTLSEVMDSAGFADDLALRAGALVVGARGAPGFRGWIDEVKLRVSEGAPLGPELTCNHARGTMVGLPHRSVAPELWDAAEDCPVGTATELSGRCACFVDYGSERHAHLGDLPAGASSLRERLLFPEGPLVSDQPRPDSSGNPFCLSCHVGEDLDPSRPAELDVYALRGGAVPLAEETRRQPMMGPRHLYGHVPAGLLHGSGGARWPPEDLIVDGAPVNVDSAVYSRPPRVR